MREYSSRYSVVKDVGKKRKSEFQKAKWRAAFRYKEDGAWHQQRFTLDSGLKKDAEDEAKAILEKLVRDAELEERRGVTVDAYLTSYIEDKARSVEGSTASQYKQMLSRHISPYLGDVDMTDLDRDTVRRWVGELSEKYASITCRKALTLLRAAMRRAEDDGAIDKDPTRGVEAPKAEVTYPNALDRDAARTVLDVMDAAPDTAHLLGIRIALHTGLREGEICGLRWQDVDLDARRLTVRRAIARGEKGYYPKEPKTKGSARDVYFGDDLADAIKGRKEALGAACKAVGIDLSGLYVIGGIDGSFMKPQTLSNRWRALAEGLDLKGTQGVRPTFHDLRHTYATLAVAAGIDIKTVSAALGHANAAMTLNTYADATKNQKQTAAQTMDNVLRGGCGNDV